MRLFVGIFLPEELQNLIWKVGEKVYGPWKREPPEKLHITLKFIGEYPEERLGLLDEALRSIRHPPLEIVVKGVGAFPSMDRPRVLWVGAFSPGLFTLQKLLEETLASLGIPREWRDFVPHITLGRAKGRVEVSDFRKLEHRYFGSFVAREFVLVRSVLKPGGSEYTVLRRYPLED